VGLIVSSVYSGLRIKTSLLGLAIRVVLTTQFQLRVSLHKFVLLQVVLKQAVQIYSGSRRLKQFHNDCD